MNLNVIKFLRENSLSALEEKYFIKFTRHNKYNNLVLLKYNQINSPVNEITKECRGIILDENNNWNVISFPYCRFFNYGEGNASNIDWKSARVYEKIDGSLMTLYYYNNEWHVSSSGVPDATGNIMGTETIFSELFWKVWKQMGYTVDNADTNCCYMFELMTPYNRVVVKHKDSKIVLHGARKLSDLNEINPIVVAHKNNWQCVNILPLQSWSDIEDAIVKINPMEGEGYVVCDENYNRVKIKSPQYVALSHMRDGLSVKKMLEIIRLNEHSEFLSYFPEYAEFYHNIKSKFEYLVGEIEGFYNAIKHIDDRKKFALIAKDQKFSGILFRIKYAQTQSVRYALSDMHINNLLDWLDLKYINFQLTKNK